MKLFYRNIRSKSCSVNSKKRREIKILKYSFFFFFCYDEGTFHLRLELYLVYLVSVHFLYTYFLQNVKFHTTKSRLQKYNIGALASRNANCSGPTKIRALQRFAQSLPCRCVIFRNILRMHQRRRYVSNIFASDIALYRGISNSYESSKVSMFSTRVFASLRLFRYAALVCLHGANTRGHAKEIACCSSIRSHGTFTFITTEQLALPLLMLRYGNPRRMRGGKWRY